MIENLAAKTACSLLKTGIIVDDDQDLYEYGFFLLYSKILFLIISIIMGLLLGDVLQSISIYILFSVIRSYAGGFHAKKESSCIFLTTVALFCTNLFAVRIQTASRTVCIIILIVFGLVIGLLSPLDNEEKPLTPREAKNYHNISIGILFVYEIIGIVSSFAGKTNLTGIFSAVLVLESILLSFGKLKNSCHGIVKTTDSKQW